MSPAAAEPVIETFAGGGVGDGGQAVQAWVHEPNGSVFDADGNLYFAEFAANRVRKIAPDGTISTVAGTGIAGFSGDGGPATAAQLDSPADVALDADGNLYIADSDNFRVRVVGTDGTIRTVAGTGEDGWTVLYWTGSIGDGGPALDAVFGQPRAVEIDAQGRVVVADRNLHRVRRFVVGGNIETIAGNGADNQYPELLGPAAGDGGPAIDATLSNPEILALDPQGRLLIGQYYPGVVRRIEADGTIDTIAGNWTYSDTTLEDVPALDAWMGGLHGVAYDADGRLWLAVQHGSRVRRVGTDGDIVTVVGEGSTSNPEPLSNPRNLTFHPDGGVVAGSDSREYELLRISSTGDVSVLAGGGIGLGAPADQMRLDDPGEVVRGGDGNLYFNSYNNIYRATPEGIVTRYIAGGGDDILPPADGTPVSDAVLTSLGGFAFSNDGRLFFTESDVYDSRLRYVDSDGLLQTISADGLPYWMYQFAFGPDGRLYLPGDRQILAVTTTGVVSVVAGTGAEGDAGDGGPALEATMSEFVGGIAVGPDGSIYFGDRAAQRVRRIAPDGNIYAFAGDGSTDPDAAEGVATAVGFSDINEIAADADGNVLIGDGARVRRVTADGMIATFAGNGSFDVTGDGGPAREAGLGGVHSIAFDADGRVYIADGEERIRRVYAAPAALPSEPLGVVADAGDGEAIVTFMAPAESGDSPITGYIVESQPVGGVDTQSGDPALSHRITGLANGTSYTFTVRAVTADGEGPASAPSAPVTPVAVVPPALSIDDASFLERDAATARTVTVRLDRASDSVVTFLVVGVSGTATYGAPGDAHGLPTGTLSLAAGEVAKTVGFEVFGDGELESDETFVVRVRNVTGATVADGEATVTLRNDDEPDVVLGADRFSVLEGHSALLPVLDNDYVGQRDTYSYPGATVAIVQAPTKGTASVAAHGLPGVLDDRIVYTVGAGKRGEDVLIYRLCVQPGVCVDAAATIVIRPTLPQHLDLASRSGFVDLPMGDLRALPSARFVTSPFVAARSKALQLGADSRRVAVWDAASATKQANLWQVPAQPTARGLDVVAELQDTGNDVQLFVGVDADGDGKPSLAELRCTLIRAPGAAVPDDGALAEPCEMRIEQAAGESVAYWTIAYNEALEPVTDGRVAVYEIPDADGTEVVATGPGTVPAGDAFEVRLVHSPATPWRSARYGYLDVESTPGQSIGRTPVRLWSTEAGQNAVPLANGRSYTFALDQQRSARPYFDVPAGATKVSVVASSPADIAMDVRKAAAVDPAVSAMESPGSTVRVGTSDAPGGDEVVILRNGDLEGRYFVYVRGPETDTVADAVVTVTIEAATPATPPGAYFNPSRRGHGLFLYPAGGDWAGLWYHYLEDGTPTWYWLQGAKPGADGIWRGGLYRGAWNGGANSLTAVGEAIVTPATGDVPSFRFSYVVDGRAGSETLEMLGGDGCPTLAGETLDASTHWFNPARAGTGYSTQLWPNYEFFAAFVYDRLGNPRYLSAERSGFGGTSATLDLLQVEGFCPTCAVKAPVYRNIGVLTRDWLPDGRLRLQIDGVYEAGVEGVWTVDEIAQTLGGPGTTQGCPN